MQIFHQNILFPGQSLSRVHTELTVFVFENSHHGLVLHFLQNTTENISFRTLETFPRTARHSRCLEM